MLALALMVVLTLVVTGFSLRLDAHVRTEILRIDQRSARLAAESGVAQAMSVLSDANFNATTDTDEWFNYGRVGLDRFQVGDSYFRVQIVDNGGRVNLNTVSREQMEKIYFSDEQIDSLLDWREDQLQPRPLGAKDEYYNSLETPYNVRLRRLETVDELLLVKGFTPKFLFDPPENVSGNLLLAGNIADQPALFDLVTVDSRSPNVRADGSAKINANTANTNQLTQAGLSQQVAQAIIQRRNTQGTFTSLGQLFQIPGLNTEAFRAILNNLTLTNETSVSGLINLNTASEAVLNSIPNLAPDQVQSILSRQGTFAELGELADLPGFTAQVLEQVGGLFTIGSQSFTIRVEGLHNAARFYLEANVIVEEGRLKILRVRPPLTYDVVTRWQWPTEPDTTTVIVD